MKGQPKKPKVPGIMRGILSNNVRQLMLVKYKGSSNKPLALSKDAGVSLSTVQRVLAASHGNTLETIEGLSGAFQIAAHQLLIQDLAATNPRILRLVTGPGLRVIRNK